MWTKTPATVRGRYTCCGSGLHVRFRAGLQEDEAAADAERDCFGTASRGQFAEDGGYVKFGGVLGNIEPGGYLFIAQTAGEHLQNFAFAWRERLGKIGDRLGSAYGGGQRGTYFRGMQNDQTGGCGMQGRDELIGSHIDGQDRADAAAQRIEGFLVASIIVENGDYGNIRGQTRFQKGLEDYVRGFAGGIEQNDVGLRFGDSIG